MLEQVFCHVDSCDRKAMYKTDAVCQKHYFRRMRYGHYGLNLKRQERLNHSNGYIVIYAKDHPLANKQGYVYEHRMVMFERYNIDLPPCQFCGNLSDWFTRKTHIDHIDEDRKNNRLQNLRVLCNACNVGRNRHEITIDGQSMSATRWAQQAGVSSSPETISRRLRLGVRPEVAVYAKTGERISELKMRQP